MPESNAAGSSTPVSTIGTPQAFEGDGPHVVGALVIEAGEGPMACAWARELAGMYRAWLDKSGLTEEQARGILAFDVGVHRLVDMHEGKRQTSFAAVYLRGFGSQVRSYVRAPYALVSDHRTGVTSEDVDGVLAGDLGRFLPSAKSPR